MENFKNTQGTWEKYPEVLTHNLSYNKSMPFRCDILGEFNKATSRRNIIASVYGKTEEEANANANIISCAKILIKTNISTYLNLLLNMPSEYRCTSSGQLLLSELRDSLEFLFNGNSQETQEHFEDLYCRIKSNELTLQQVIDSIIL